MKNFRIAATAVACLLSIGAIGAARADVTVGVSISLTGPGSALGVPTKNGISLWPASMGGEKLNILMLDDATDPTTGVKNTRRFVTEDKVDVIVGSVITPVAIAMSEVAAENQTLQLALSPMALPEGKGAWSFRLPQSTGVMAIPIVAHWKKTGVKTFGFLGFADAYGEAWLADITAQAKAVGITPVDVERFARTDTSVTGQALKLVAAKPDAILIAASGSGAAMPHKGLVERGYAKDKIFQTHGAATMDLMRVGGKDVDGSFVSSGPALVANLLPDSNPSKKLGQQYIANYDKAFGAGTANQFGAHAFDVAIVLERIIPEALKKGKPGTQEFRTALRDSLETTGRLPVSQGVLNYTKTDHFGFTPDTGVLLKVVNGNWTLAP